MSQSVVVQLVHQRDQAAQFAGREALASKPAEVMSWQIGDQAAFIFSVGHLVRDQALQLFSIHERNSRQGKWYGDGEMNMTLNSA